ncbi:hypothetical protein A2U01_0074032, partial [Trifolium medium]|nr:hypothetical protein [Trifolium medium]
SQRDLKDVYQGSRMPNVGPGANHAISHNGEAHQKFKAIEDKLRMMESFLLSNDCSLHPYSQHLTAAQHQQPQGFPNQQAIQMPFNPLQASQFAQNPG